VHISLSHLTARIVTEGFTATRENVVFLGRVDLVELIFGIVKLINRDPVS